VKPRQAVGCIWLIIMISMALFIGQFTFLKH